MIFGTLKAGSLQINSSTSSNNRFSYRNVFQNEVNALSKMVLKTGFSSISSEIPYSFDNMILFKFHWPLVPIFFKECMERLETSNFSIGNGNTVFTVFFCKM